MKWRNLNVVLCVGVAACASTSHVGRWGHDDAKHWAGVKLNSDGSCLIVGGAKGSVGGGLLCRYSMQGNTVTITEVFDGAHWSAPPERLTMTPLQGRDAYAASWEKGLELERVERLLWEP